MNHIPPTSLKIISNESPSKPSWYPWILGLAAILVFFFVSTSSLLESRSPKQKRMDLIQQQFSRWDGSHKRLVEYVKAGLPDPDAFRHYQTAYQDNGDHLIVLMRYGVADGFDMTIEVVEAIVDLREDTNNLTLSSNLGMYIWTQ